MSSYRPRVLSGMRPTGKLHLGHYFLLEKWVQMQKQFDCHYFVADYHAMTNALERSGEIGDSTRQMVICWLAAGIDPEKSVLFVQSQLREHAELHVLLSMVCPLPWVERVPTYRAETESLRPDEVSYGFLGYPVLQAADIIVHGADEVPVGDDQEAHVEIATALARRFNDIFGKDPDWEKKARALADSFAAGGEFARLQREVVQNGDADARARLRDMVMAAGLDREDRQRLLGWIEGGGRQLLVPPAVRKAEVSRLEGLDGGKMSKSAGNHIGMLEEKEQFAPRIRTMPTDPARVRRNDPGDPGKCPVWGFHKLFSAADDCARIDAECRTAAIGCTDCKAILVDGIERKVAPLRERAAAWDYAKVDEVLAAGNERARQSAAATMSDVRHAVGLQQV